MQPLNYKHLHYFWVVTKSGGVAKAGEQLHVTPQSISTQIRQLETSIGKTLWRRAGRKLQLTDTGHLVFEHAERLFSVGEELKAALEGQQGHGPGVLRVGVCGSVVKVVAYRLLAPALHMPERPRLLCREGRFSELLALLAVHELDMVVSDRTMPSAMNVRGFNHLLAEGGVTFLAAPALARKLGSNFPDNLHGAPFLLPGADSAVRPRLMQWLDKHQLRPDVVAEFDDTAVLKAFGQEGAGVFVMPTMVAEETARQFRVRAIGQTDDIQYQVFAVSGERRLVQPAVLAISEASRSLRQRNSRSAVRSVSPPA